MNIRPMYDCIVVKRLESDQQTEGGIFIPETAKEKSTEGRVIAVGAGKLMNDGSLRPLVVREGDVVLFGRYNGTEVKIGGEECIILREEDVFAILTPVAQA